MQDRFPWTQSARWAGWLFLTLSVIAPTARADDAPTFRGWEALRVAALDGKLSRLVAGDIDGDGRPELLVPNPRRGRIEIFEWREKENRLTDADYDPDNPNFLPLAPEFAHGDLSLDDVPRAVLTRDLDGDGRDEVLILIDRPLRVLAYSKVKDAWKKVREYRLQDGELAGTASTILARPGTNELYVSFREGIQIVDLASDEAATWVQPKSRQRRDDWWFADLDGDGDDDLVGWSTTPASVHWFENVGGELRSPVELTDQSLIEVVPYRQAGKPVEVVGMRKAQPGVLKRYRLTRGEANPVGKRHRLSLPDSTKSWTSVTLDGRTAFVYPDPTQPRLIQVYLDDSGWSQETNFPIVSDVVAVAAPLAKPGTLLLHSKDAGDLHVSTWEQGRLTYPRPMPQSEDVEDRRILALETAGKTVWWAQRAGTDLDLYLWNDVDPEPRRVRYAGVGEKVDRVKWLGGTSVLVMEKYAAAPKLIQLKDDGTPKVTDASRLKKISLDDLHLVRVGPAECPSGPGGPYLARIADGVLQWLDANLYPIDQVMLPAGKRLVNYVVLEDGTPWALEHGGEKVHRLEPDESGILRVADSIELPGGQSLIHDARLGLVLIDGSGLTQLGPGEPIELELVESFEPENSHTAGATEPRIHRIATEDLDGDGSMEIIAFDDIRRELTAYSSPEDHLKSLVTWRVYDDKTYPYGGASGRDRVAEPRTLLAVDLDVDGIQDLALICHERLLIYLGREEE